MEDDRGIGTAITPAERDTHDRASCPGREARSCVSRDGRVPPDPYEAVTR